MRKIITGILAIGLIIGFISGAIFVPGIMLLEWLFPGNSIIYVGMALLFWMLYHFGIKYIEEGGE